MDPTVYNAVFRGDLAGPDDLIFTASQGVVRLGAGPNRAVFEQYVSEIRGGADRDVFTVLGGAQSIRTGAGADTVRLDSFADTVRMGKGSDLLILGDDAGANSVNMGNGRNVIVGEFDEMPRSANGFIAEFLPALDDAPSAGGGFIGEIRGGANADIFLLGDRGANAVLLGEANGSLAPGVPAFNLLVSTAFIGEVRGAADDDFVVVGGANTVRLGAGFDIFSNNDWVNELRMGSGDDVAILFGGANTALLGAGDDVLVALDVVNDARGGQGEDIIVTFGGGVTHGGKGEDWFAFGEGSSFHHGDSGDDIFFFDVFEGATDAFDRVVGGNGGESDGDTLVVFLAELDGFDVDAFAAEYEAFADSGGSFHFASLNLEVSEVETLVVETFDDSYTAGVDDFPSVITPTPVTAREFTEALIDELPIEIA